MARPPCTWQPHKGNQQVVDILLEANANPGKCRDGDGKTPLELAEQAGNIEVVEQLLKHKAEAMSDEGMSDSTTDPESEDDSPDDLSSPEPRPMGRCSEDKACSGGVRDAPPSPFSGLISRQGGSLFDLD